LLQGLKGLEALALKYVHEALRFGTVDYI